MLFRSGNGDQNYTEAHDTIMNAIEWVLKEGPHTPDLGGNAKTQDIGQAICDRLRA